MVYDILETDLAGTLILAGDEKGLRHLNFLNGRHPLVIGRTWRRDKSCFKRVRSQLADYFSGSRRSFDVRYHCQGTPFQTKVWRVLETVPYGRVVSYQWVADRIGCPAAARAVGAANGRNPISIIIPCHRVIGKNGNLTGYGGGLAVKERLLRLENQAVTVNTGLETADQAFRP